jgi:hypothetical protein
MWLLALLLLLPLSLPHAATRFFAGAGDNENPCTEAAPCRNAAPFEASLQPGDRLLFHRGDVFEGKEFALNPQRSGQRDNVIYYGAYGLGAKPVIASGDPTTGGHGGADGLRMRGVSWIVVEDLAFTGWGSAVDLGGVQDITLRRVASTGGSSEACVHIKQYSGQPSQRVVLEDVELAQCGVNSNGEGVYIGTNPGQDGAGDATSDIVLRRVVIHVDKDEGIEVKNCARRVQIEDSRIIGSGQAHQTHGIALAPSSADCPQSNGEHVIRRTVVENTQKRGIHVGTGATIAQSLFRQAGKTADSAGIWVEDLPGDQHPVEISRNAVMGSAGAAIQVQSSAQAATTVGTNLAIGNGSGNTPLPTPPPGPCPPAR